MDPSSRPRSALRIPAWGPALPGAALLLSALALAAALSLQKIRSFDYWWHLRTGQLIAETGSVPRTDPFTFTAAGARWIDIHWLHQLGLHALHALGGHSAVVLGKGALALLLAGILASFGDWRRRPLAATVPLVLALLVVSERFMPRPELPSFVLLAAQLALFDRFRRRGDRAVYAVVPLQLLWVNVHGLFALGIAVTAMYAVAEGLRPALHPGEPWRPKRLRRLAAVLGLSVAASALNPNGLDGALYPIRQLAMIASGESRSVFGSVIVELIPPLAAGGRDARLPLLGLAAGLAGLSLLAMLLNWRRLHAADPILWGAFLYLGLAAQRNLALFAIVAAPIATRNLGDWLERRAPPAGPARRLRAPARALAAAGVLGLAWTAAAGWLAPRLGVPREPGLGVMAGLHPVAAADWIERHGPSGPLCHHMADGGYLIWRLHPRYPVMSDGRLEVFGEERFLALQYHTPEEFRAVDERYGCGLVLVRYALVESVTLLRWLYLHPRWQLVFVDESAALFAGRPAAGDIAWPAVDLDAPDLFGPEEPAGPAQDVLRRTARSLLLGALGRSERALAELEETLRRHPDAPRGRALRAVLLELSGRTVEAERALAELIAERPEEAELRLRAGDLRLRSEDVSGARQHYDRALAFDPKLPAALQRRGLVAELQGHPAQAARLYRMATRSGRVTDPAVALAARRLDALGARPGDGSGGT